MPISPENKARYPKDWPAIRARILEREGHCCKWCGVANGIYGYRDAEGRFHQLDGMALEVAGLDGVKTVRIVLTVAHVQDPSPEACDDANLAALCQRCHLRHDAPMHKRNAARTRLQKKAVGALPLLEARS